MPSVVLGLLYTVAQTDLIRSYMPDLFLAIWAFAISLYIGAVIKLIAMFIYTKKKHTAGVELEEQTAESEEATNSLVEKNEDKSVDKEDTEASKTEEKPADSTTDNTGKKSLLKAKQKRTKKNPLTATQKKQETNRLQRKRISQNKRAKKNLLTVMQKKQKTNRLQRQKKSPNRKRQQQRNSRKID